MTDSSLHIDKVKSKQLIIGIIGINFTYILFGILFEWITTQPYQNIFTHKMEKFQSSAGLVTFQRGGCWILAAVWNSLFIDENQKIKKEMKNVELVGFLVFLSTMTNVEAIRYVSYPLTIIVKSTNILSVILVGVSCSGVTDSQLKLGPKKLLAGFFITSGIIVYNIFDPQFSNKAEQTQTKIFGILLLVTSLIIDGFIPDYEQQIKQNYHPKPTQLLENVNKWTSIIGFCYVLVKNQLIYTFHYCIFHPTMALHLLGMVILSFVGQIFVYRVIMNFRQHVVGFIIAGRKMVTVVLSLILFHHKTTIGQICGIAIVFIVIVTEFCGELQTAQPKSQQQIKNNQIQQI